MPLSISISGDWRLIAIAILSAALTVMVVAISPRMPRFYGHTAIKSSIQAIHLRPTPRVGGVAIFGAVGVSATLLQQDLWGSYSGILIGGVPLFVVGLLEDLGFGVSPTKRLLAAIGSSLIVILLTGLWLPRLGIPGADHLASYAMIGVPLTLLVTAGVTNGFNLIDGVNGMAGMTAIGAAFSLSAISATGGNSELWELNLIFVAAVAGFCLLNFPFGLVFLGDAGAYTLGFMLAWFGIAILADVPDVSPWAVLLCVFWPVADMMLAIFRRRLRKAEVTVPDRLHVHQLVMRSLEICLLGRSHRKFANPLTTVVLAPFVLTPPAVGVLLWNDNAEAFIAVVFFASVFVISYTRIPNLVRKLRTRPSGTRAFNVEPSVTRATPTS